VVTTSKILSLRLHNTGLSRSPFKNAAEAVGHLGAVQAQDFGAAKWALGLRINNSTDADIEQAFNQGAILRTHVMRPTWHFVLPEDIRWMEELTAPRVKAFLAPYNRKLELDDALLAKCEAVMVKALRNHHYLTRQELKTILKDAGIETGVQRLAHIISWAELDGLVCSGPKIGKQLTYALLEERAAKAKRLSREQALAQLALKYFSSHGPAQAGDFSWWSGLTVADARDAIDMLKADLQTLTKNGKTYWYPVNQNRKISRPPAALLLSVYDEYTIAYKDRSDISDAGDVERMFTSGAAFTAVIILNGRGAGSWSKSLKKNSIEVKLNPLRGLTEHEQKAIRTEVARFSKFTGVPAVLVE
jgi:hypothetical protein